MEIPLCPFFPSCLHPCPIVALPVARLNCFGRLSLCLSGATELDLAMRGNGSEYFVQTSETSGMLKYNSITGIDLELEVRVST